MSRRAFARTLTQTLALAAAGAAGSFGPFGLSGLARAATPLKIGLLAPLSGPLTRVGETNRNCAALAIDEINAAGGVLGRPLQLLVEDTQMSTAVALDKARQLFMRDDVAMLTGMVLPAEREAALQAAVAARRLVVYPNFDEGRCHAQLLTTGLAMNQRIEPAIQWLVREVGKKVCVVVSDMGSNRRTLVPQLQVSIERHGGTLVDVSYFPFGTRDFGAVLQRIAALRPQIVWHSIGDDPVTFVKQYRSFSMEPQLVSDIAHESLSIATEGASTGTLGVSSYFMSLDNAANRAFLARYTARYADAHAPRLGASVVVLPHGENTYAGIQLFAQAVHLAGSIEPGRVKAALPRLSLALPRGPVSVTGDGGHVLCATRIGRARTDNSFEILASTGPIAPTCQT
ncbi:ABC transporter substrate-binding protein [Paraburkholderia sp. BL10I2N1]|uniref:ABC transporter substrate-binding protein n=1 Tax=Paraburkholderia sp. BL10I2N1 TaxID=1938796 RepID=UPI00105E77B0|nr:ABC transporter substrate-binding protein [Paraburkholderia sp. BL10I2N1]